MILLDDVVEVSVDPNRNVAPTAVFTSKQPQSAAARDVAIECDNALDQLISVTDPRSRVTSYTYNALGDLTQQVSPDTGTTTNTYDSGGNLATSTDARSKTGTYIYDALNRVTGVTYPDQTISYTYDGGTNQKGRLTQVSDASGSTSWTYDTHGRVLSRQQSMGVSKTLGYAYDSGGLLQTLVRLAAARPHRPGYQVAHGTGTPIRTTAEAAHIAIRVDVLRAGIRRVIGMSTMERVGQGNGMIVGGIGQIDINR